MSLPLAAAGAIALALLELSVAPTLAVAGIVPDLVFISVVTIAAVFGLERASRALHAGSTDVSRETTPPE